MPSVDAMTASAPTTEHFVTLFDRNFLPAGLALLHSLRQHGQPFHLWIVCMDEVVEQQLRDMCPADVSLLPLREVENAALLMVKPSRSVAEYCWTLTPFTADFVMQRQPGVTRVTYLDADLYFFNAPNLIFDEFSATGAHVLISEHAYAAEYDQSRRSGIYCVQFMTFRNTPEGRAILAWWQARCIEWCYARVEDGKFGDQKYLDDWPQRFPGVVHVLQERQLALGPWNTTRFPQVGVEKPPVFFHFHGLRIVAEDRLCLCWGYRLSPAAYRLYDAYLVTLLAILADIRSRYGAIPVLPEARGLKQIAKRTVLKYLGRVLYQKI